MTTAVFDTLKASRDLKAAGIDEAHAEAIVATVAGAFEDTVATQSDIVAVRADIEKLESSTKADMANLRAELKAEIAEVKTELKAEIAGVKTDIDKLEASTKAEIAGVKADVFRALWIQGAGLVGIQLAIAALLFAAIRFLVLKQPF